MGVPIGLPRMEEGVARMRETERRDDGVMGDQAGGLILASGGADIRVSAQSSPARATLDQQRRSTAAVSDRGVQG